MGPGSRQQPEFGCADGREGFCSAEHRVRAVAQFAPVDFQHDASLDLGLEPGDLGDMVFRSAHTTNFPTTPVTMHTQSSRSWRKHLMAEASPCVRKIAKVGEIEGQYDPARSIVMLAMCPSICS